MTAQDALTEQDVVAARAETAAGRPVPVWFTAAAVGVPAGGTAAVVSVGEVAEGDFIKVRPAGSRDTVFCAPNELTRTRPARRRPARRKEERAPAAATTPDPDRTPAAAAAAAGPAPAPRSAGPAASAPATAAAAEAPAPSTAGAPAAASTGSPATASTGVRAASTGVRAASTTGVPAEEPPAAPPARRAAARRRPGRPTGTTVTLTATPDGDWSVEVHVGTRRAVPATPVPAVDVAAAARILPPAVVEAIAPALESARERQRARVAELRAEFDAAQRVLEQLGH